MEVFQDPHLVQTHTLTLAHIHCLATPRFNCVQVCEMSYFSFSVRVSIIIEILIVFGVRMTSMCVVVYVVLAAH